MTTHSPQTIPTGTHRTPHIRLGEKLAYAAGDVGSNVIYAPATAFILFYLTNIAGIGAAIAGTVLLVGQLLNGLTDITVGILIDKTNTQWGKTRPWVLLSSVPLAVAFVLLFSVPAGFDETGKVIWTLVMYTLVMAVFFTASNVAYSALLAVMTPSPKTRVTLTTFRFFAAIATTLVVSYLTLPLVEALGGGQSGWTKASIIYGIIAVLTLAIVFAGTRERVKTSTSETNSAKQPLRVLLRDLFRNKYFFLATGLFVGTFMLLSLGSSAGVYYATNILGDPALFGTLSLAQLAPVLLALGFMPALLARYGKRNMFLVGIAFQLVGALIPLIAPESFIVVLVGLLIRGLGTVPAAAGLFAIVADVVDYGEWRFGVRTDGLIYSSVVFGQKLGGGLGTAVVGWILAFGGYDAAASRQSAAATQSILALYIYLPVILILAVGVLTYFFKIERHSPEIQKYLSNHVVDPSSLTKSEA